MWEHRYINTFIFFSLTSGLYQFSTEFAQIIGTNTGDSFFLPTTFFFYIFLTVSVKRCLELTYFLPLCFAATPEFRSWTIDSPHPIYPPHGRKSASVVQGHLCTCLLHAGPRNGLLPKLHLVTHGWKYLNLCQGKVYKRSQNIVWTFARTHPHTHTLSFSELCLGHFKYKDTSWWSDSMMISVIKRRLSAER